MFWMISCIPYIVFADTNTNVCSIINSIIGTCMSFYILFFRDAIPITVMIIFGILAYRNMRQTVVLVHQGTDRQWMNMMRMQVILIVISAAPYIFNSIYSQISAAFPKDSYQLANESFVKTIISVNSYIQHAVSIENVE
jgi:hypothetical protein